MVRVDPGPHDLALRPRGVIPDQQEGRHALPGEALTTPGQQVGRDRHEGAPIDESQPQLVGLARAVTHQHPITGQGFRVRSCHLGTRGGSVPRCWSGWARAAPPDLVGIAKRPGGVPAG
jgi:hypothetical protein